MSSPTGVLPEALMNHQSLRQVIEFLIGAHLPGRLKRNILQGWAMSVGAKVRQRDYKRVEESGFDYQ